MKAIVQDRYGGVDTLDLRDIDMPTIQTGEVLVKVRAAGLDPSVWHLMTGRPYLVRVVARGMRKQVRGWDMSGTVEAVGSDVRGFEQGDEVFGTCNGSFAEFTSAGQDTIAAKPRNLTFEQASAIPISGCTALQALRDAGQVQPGQRVLIVGAGGGVGTFAVQIAKAFGANVTGVCSTANVGLVKSIGADAVIDYTQEDFTNSSNRFDVIVDTAGRRSLSSLRRVLTPSGTLVIVGGEGGGHLLGGFDRGFRGQVLSLFIGQRIRQLGSKVKQADLFFVKKLVEDGKVVPVVDTTYPLADVPDAIRRWERGHARGKTVITI